MYNVPSYKDKKNKKLICVGQWRSALIGWDYRDHNIHIERARYCMNVIMTQHGSLHKGFHFSWLRWAHWYKQTIFCLDKWPNLGYAVMKLKIACMYALACLHTLSLCVHYDLYGWDITGVVIRASKLQYCYCTGLRGFGLLRSNLMKVYNSVTD